MTLTRLQLSSAWTLEFSNGSIVNQGFEVIRHSNGPWDERVDEEINNGLQTKLIQLNLV